MQHTISALVENRPGVLADMTDRFRKRNLNIRSISCGETENPEISRMVIRLDSDEDEIAVVTEAMRKVDYVIRIDDLAREDFVDRELVMLKVPMDRESTSRLMQIFEVFRANVVGMGETTITVELAGDSGRIQGFIRMLEPFGIKSMCRTGAIALKRGDE